ncbi:MAG: metalloregulator ArsR/SmtB family transcription factor [Caldimonas sp.]
MKASPVKKTAAAGAKKPIRRATKATVSVAALQARAHDAAALLKALANPDRLLLLCHLVETERAVGELGEMTGIAQPTLSQQLGVLRAEGLVATRREGKSIFYRIASPAVHAVLQTLYDLFCNDGKSSIH